MIYTARLNGDGGGENRLLVDADGPGQAAVKAADRDFRERNGWEREDCQTWEIWAPDGHWTVELERQQVPVFFVTSCRPTEQRNR